MNLRIRLGDILWKIPRESQIYFGDYTRYDVQKFRADSVVGTPEGGGENLSKCHSCVKVTHF